MYYHGVPSIVSTLKQFHACKDLPEIKRDVFKLLKNYETNVIVTIKRKFELAYLAKKNYSVNKQKINDNDIYDDLITMLFRNLLNKADENIISFARRGKSLRTDALNKAIQRAKMNFEVKFNLELNNPTKIFSLYPFESVGLQVIDYYLWALQRFYEKKEDRYYNYIAHNYKLIMDLDDKRYKEYGQWYNDKNILTLDKIKTLEN